MHLKRPRIFPIWILLVAGGIQAQAQDVKTAFPKLPLRFEANVGQTDAKVQFLCRGRGSMLYLSAGDAVLDVRAGKDCGGGAVLRMAFAGSRPVGAMEGIEELPGKTSYFLGKDPRNWRIDVPSFAMIRQREIYPGTDLIYYGGEGGLEYDLIISPGARPEAIRIAFEGFRDLRIDEDGDLKIELLPERTITWRRPRLYQESPIGRIDVGGRYVLSDRDTVAFEVDAYDGSRDLVIDPSLSYSTYLGDAAADSALAIAVDSSGNAYVTGLTYSSSFPTTPGAYDRSLGGNSDAFVAKLSSSGSGLTYSTFLGGGSTGDDEMATGIAVDSSGNAYVVGQTNSSTFPATTGAYQTTRGGDYDAFVAKLSSDGSALTYATYLGGSGVDQGKGIAVDSGGCAYVTGNTYSSNFPATSGAYDTGLDGTETSDIFMTKLSSDGTGADYSTYLGGGDTDAAGGIAIDSSGNAFVAGFTRSSDYPTTDGAYQTAFDGSIDAIVTKMNSSGTDLVYSTYLGGTETEWGDYCTAIAVDSSGNAYVTGQTDSSDFPTTTGAYDTSFNGGSWCNDCFITKMNSGGTGLLYSTFLGGTGDEICHAIALDSSGNAFVTGQVMSDDFPTTADAYDAVLGLGSDAFLVRIGSSGGGLVYSTYFGGSNGEEASGDEYANGIAFNGGSAYLVGTTTSSDLPTLSAYQDTYGGGNSDVFIAKFTMNPTAARVISFEALREGGRVYLRWRTGHELDNLGFHVYREEGGRRIRQTPELLAGTVLLGGAGMSLAGHSYEWIDASPSGTEGARYWLEDIDLDGRRCLHGPCEIKESPGPDPVAPAPSGGARIDRRGSPGVSGAPSGPRRTRGRSDPLPSRALALPDRSPPGGSGLTPLEVQGVLAAGPSMKIEVGEDAWYRIGAPELMAAGLSPEADVFRLRLFAEGVEAPLRLVLGKDHRLRAIEFFGTAIDTPWSGTRVYWLAQGARPGKCIPLVPRPRGSMVPPARSFPFAVDLEERTNYFAALKNGEEADNFFGPMVATEPVERTLTVRHLDPSAPEGVLEVALQGVTTAAHIVKVLLNDVPVAEVRFEGKVRGMADARLPAGAILEGENRVSLSSLGGQADVSLVDLLRLTYRHTYAADGDALMFTAREGQGVTVTGFSLPQIRVLDITDPMDVRELSGAVVRSESGCAVRIVAPRGGERRLFAFEESCAETPGSIFADRPSRWRDPGNEADLVIIAHGDLVESIEPLKARRTAEGWSVAIVDVEDIYDEFAFGEKSPAAIREFLRMAKAAWRRPPSHVLLAGDASFDPRNRTGLGDLDLVPTRIVETEYLETASDDWFVDFSGDGLPSMAIGRLPVRSPEEADAVVSKIVGYAPPGEGESRPRGALLVADRNDGFDFEAACEEIGALLPAEMPVRKIYLDRTDAASARGWLLGCLEEGPSLVDYFGHGSVEVWRGGLFDRSDAAVLGNGPRLPLFISMTCLNGFFHDVRTECLGEALLKAPRGGAIASWASSALTEPHEQVALNRRMIELLFGEEPMTLGEAAAIAKRAVASGDIRRTWILFGDPTTRLAR